MIWPDADEDRETHQVLVMTYQSWLGKIGKSSIFYHCTSGKSWKSTICGCFPVRKVGDLWVFLSSFPVEVQFHCRNLCSAMPSLNSYKAGHPQIVWMCGLWSTVYRYVWQTGSRKQLIVEGHRLVTILPFNRLKKNSRVELPWLWPLGHVLPQHCRSYYPSKTILKLWIWQNGKMYYPI